MKFVILMGSPRTNGNTAHLCKPFIERLRRRGAQTVYIPLEDKIINPCRACYACQNVQDEYGCVQQDDMELIVNEIVSADCIVFATPIYSWYCPAKMKALLDRHYGMNKFYGSASGSLWQGKKVAIIATHGYDRDYACSPFETGIKRLCEHSNLDYVGLYSVRDEDDLASFTSEEAVNGAIEFADKLLQAL